VARLPYVDPAEAPSTVRDALENTPPLNVFRMTAHASTAFRPFLRYGGTLLARLDLDPVLRELAILRVAVCAGCDYERVQHEPIAAGVGASAEEIARAVEPGVSAEGTEGLVYDLVEESFRQNRAAPATTDALLAALGEQGLIELLLVVGQYHGLAVLMNTVEIDLDEEAGMAVLQSARSGRPAES
jgi:4-carboxymuconolactone decarboxylase